jgi:hypothetical protein
MCPSTPTLARRSATTPNCRSSALRPRPRARLGTLHHPPPNQVLCRSDGYPGRTYKLSLDGKVLGVFSESGKQLKQFGWIHEIPCPSANDLYVSELLNWRVQNVILESSH